MGSDGSSQGDLKRLQNNSRTNELSREKMSRIRLTQ